VNVTTSSTTDLGPQYGGLGDLAAVPTAGVNATTSTTDLAPQLGRLVGDLAVMPTAGVNVTSSSTTDLGHSTRHSY